MTGSYTRASQMRFARTSREAGQDHLPFIALPRVKSWLTIIGEFAAFIALMALALAVYIGG